MNRNATTLAVALTALAAGAPAQAASGPSDSAMALRYSARADVQLQSGLDLAGRGRAASGRVVHALKSAHSLELKAAAAARRSLDSGRSTSAKSVKSAGRVLSRLDAAGHTELAVLRASSDKHVQEQAAQGVDLNAQLTSSLQSKIGSSGGSGATVADKRSQKIDGIVARIEQARPSVRFDSARARLDHAISVLIESSHTTADTPTAPSGSNAQGSQVSTSASADASSSSETNLGQLSSATSQANATGVAGHPKP